MTIPEMKKILADLNLTPVQHEIARRFASDVNRFQGEWISVFMGIGTGFGEAHKATDAGLLMALLASMNSTEPESATVTNPRGI